MSIILLVEDDLKQAELLKKSLLKYNRDIKILHAHNAKQAFENAIKYKIDLFIFDIGLPDKPGLDLAEEIQKLPQYKVSRMIFITAYPQYLPNAVRKVHCYDYITKPYNSKEVSSLVNDILNNKIVLKDEKDEEFFTVKRKEIIYKIPVKDILFIDVNLRECNIHTYSNIYSINRLGLKEAYQKLPEHKFKQCHKSTLVNIDYVNITKKEGSNWEISLLNYPKKVLVGRKYKDDFFNSLLLKDNNIGEENGK